MAQLGSGGLQTSRRRLKANILSRAPRTRRRRRGTRSAPVSLLVLAALGIAAYWYAVFVVIEPPGGEAAVAVGRAGATPRSSDAVGHRDTAVPGAASSVGGLADALIRDAIVRTAEGMLARDVVFDDSYRALRYPGGDVPADRGTSADLLVRALRGAGFDLQVALQEDRQRAPQAYPLQRWKRKTPDRSVDHRRVANQAAFLKRHAQAFDAAVHDRALQTYLPGDIVLWGSVRSEYPTNVGIVRAARAADGAPYVITMAPKERGISGHHLLTEWFVKGHYRVTQRLFEPPQPEPKPAECPVSEAFSTASGAEDWPLESCRSPW